jgi:hypothetical protein
LRETMKAVYEANGSTASQLVAGVIKVPPPPITDDNKQAVAQYVSSSAALNVALRNHQGSGALSDFSSFKSQVDTLDKMMESARDYAVPIRMMRGIPKHVVSDFKVGDTFADKAYCSTSFSKSKSNDFGDSARLHITLPKGFKFLSIPSWAKASGSTSHYAMAEAEAILPRGTGFKINKIETENHRTVLHVHAIFSSIQPSRDKWVSTKAAKLKKSDPNASDVQSAT